ncbi:MAG: MBL fold metallo-hydrolase [Betaproteobacteria bacterium]|nr:MBL fold metallo-hydrolase [Betaproteobacteria bacterium]
MLRFKNLGSGSAGNATLVEAHGGVQVSRVLIDCGLSLRELDKRLIQAELTLEDIDAVFITHEHADHVGHARAFAQRTGAQVWMSKGTALACELEQWGLHNGQCHVARDGQAIAVGALQLIPFTVPHDAREPLQLRCTDGDVHLGVLTDLGHGSSHVVQALKGCNALLLECNHDPELLANSSYPGFLKKRIAGPQGHLSNLESAELARALLHPRLNLIVAAHLSERNNRPNLAQTVLGQAADCAPSDIQVADPVTGTNWYQVH